MQSNILTMPPASTHQEALAQLHQKYANGLQRNDFIPFTYPMTTYGAAVLLLYFLIPPSSKLHCRLTRYGIFAVTAAWHAFLILNTRGYAMPVTFGIGIVAGWGILWSAVVLVFNDAKRDFRRVKKLEKPRAAAAEQDQAGAKSKDCNGYKIHSKELKKYIWQRYPTESWRERWDWSIDILCNFRGVGWDWTVAVIPSRPLSIQQDLKNDSKGSDVIKDVPISRNGIKRYDSRWGLLFHNAWLICKGYLALDLMKLLMNRDPYFWGQINCKPPSYLPLIMQKSFFLLRGYRLTVTMTTIWLVLRTIFSFGPLVFVGLFGDQYLGSNGESWMYADHYGSYSNVLDRGLAGWWGGWWHQTFRFAFESTGNWLIRQVGIKPKSTAARTTQIFTAFVLSGFLHGCGSMTMLGESKPWSRMFMFFLLQPIGLMIEASWRGFLKEAGLMPLIPSWMSKTLNFVYVHLWFYITAPLLADDFARGGVWLFEPIMLSPLRGLGFGVEGDGFFCWGGKWFTWYRDPTHWWLSGVVL